MKSLITVDENDNVWIRVGKEKVFLLTKPTGPTGNYKTVISYNDLDIDFIKANQERGE